jgi:hypothetical protein
MKLKIGLALAALTLAASPAFARDPFVGGYDGGDNVCARNVSCSLIISDPLDGGKAYDVDFEAEQQGRSADGLITRKTLCKTTVRMSRDGKRLKGSLADGQTIELAATGGASITVSKSSGRPCGLPFSISGLYEAIGD